MSAPDRGSARRGFLVLVLINLVIVGCALLRWPVLPDRESWGTVILLFPFLQLAWSLPMLTVAGIRGRYGTLRGMALAVLLTFFVSYAWWLLIANNIGFD